MDRDMLLRHLAEVERHIVQGETHLAKQSALIAELERHGHDTRGAQAVLTTMREQLNVSSGVWPACQSRGHWRLDVDQQ